MPLFRVNRFLALQKIQTKCNIRGVTMICLIRYCSKVRMKEGSGQGWIVETRVILFAFLYKLKQVRTLRVLGTSTLSVVSAITLCVRSGCLSRHRPCARVSTPSLSALPFHGGFYPSIGLHANYCNQTQVFLILHLTHLLTAVS